MEPGGLPVVGSHLNRIRPAPSRHPSTSKNCDATIPHHSIPLRPRGTPVPAIPEISVCHSTHRGCSSNVFPLMAPVDDGIRVSSVAPLTIRRRINIPAFLQRLADFCLSK